MHNLCWLRLVITDSDPAFLNDITALAAIVVSLIPRDAAHVDLYALVCQMAQGCVGAACTQLGITDLGDAAVPLHLSVSFAMPKTSVSFSLYE